MSRKNKGCQVWAPGEKWREPRTIQSHFQMQTSNIHRFLHLYSRPTHFRVREPISPTRTLGYLPLGDYSNNTKRPVVTNTDLGPEPHSYTPLPLKRHGGTRRAHSFIPAHFENSDFPPRSGLAPLGLSPPRPGVSFSRLSRPSALAPPASSCSSLAFSSRSRPEADSLHFRLLPSSTQG